MIQEGQSEENSVGMCLLCPQCAGDMIKKHFITLLFDQENVPEEMNPPGRWTVLGDMKPIDQITLKEKVRSEHCDWTGYLMHGGISWK